MCAILLPKPWREIFVTWKRSRSEDAATQTAEVNVVLYAPISILPFRALLPDAYRDLFALYAVKVEKRKSEL